MTKPDNTTTVYYVKRGRRYHPISYYDHMLMSDGWPQGYHLVHVSKNGRTRRYNVDPDWAGVISALMAVRDELADLLSRASQPEPGQGSRSVPMSPELRDDWQRLVERHGQELAVMHYPSRIDIAEAVCMGLMERIQDTDWDRPAVQKALDHLLTVAKLSKK